MSARRYLQNLSNSVSDFSFWQCPQERRINDSMKWLMIISKPVLHSIPVDSYTVEDRRIDQANETARDPVIQCRSTVDYACKSSSPRISANDSLGKSISGLSSASQLEKEGKVQPNSVGHQSAPDYKNRLSTQDVKLGDPVTNVLKSFKTLFNLGDVS